MTRQEASELMVTSPVIRPTSWNSSHSCLYFYARRQLVKHSPPGPLLGLLS